MIGTDGGGWAGLMRKSGFIVYRSQEDEPLKMIMAKRRWSAACTFRSC